MNKYLYYTLWVNDGKRPGFKEEADVSYLFFMYTYAAIAIIFLIFSSWLFEGINVAEQELMHSLV